MWSAVVLTYMGVKLRGLGRKVDRVVDDVDKLRDDFSTARLSGENRISKIEGLLMGIFKQLSDAPQKPASFGQGDADLGAFLKQMFNDLARAGRGDAAPKSGDPARSTPVTEKYTSREMGQAAQGTRDRDEIEAETGSTQADG